MAIQPYNLKIRKAQLLERRARVAAATAELHAEKGVLSTSYADIALRAQVSLPTVHSYFPTQVELLTACTGHAGAAAPPLPVQALMATSDLHAAAEMLVAAVDRQHAYFEPWLSWRQETVTPFLVEMSAGHRDHLTALITQLLKRHRKGTQAAHAAAWESLLSFDLWQRLTRQHRLPRRQVRALLTNLLMTVPGPAPSTTPKPGPRRSS